MTKLKNYSQQNNAKLDDAGQACLGGPRTAGASCTARTALAQAAALFTLLCALAFAALPGTAHAAADVDLESRATDAGLNIGAKATIETRGFFTFYIKDAGVDQNNYLYSVASMDLEYGGSYIPETRYPASEEYANFSASKQFSPFFAARGDYRLKVIAFDKNTQQKAGEAMVYFTVSAPSLPYLYDRVDQVASTIDTSASVYDKALAVHNKVMELSSHEDTSGVNCGPTGVLLKGNGTSESYYYAMQLLMKKLGVVIDMAQEGNSYWALVPIDGSWMHVDACFDDKLEQNSAAPLKNLYFGLTDDQMKRLRPNYRPVAHTATNPRLNYYIVKEPNQYYTWYNAIFSQAEAQVNAGRTAFELALPGGGDPALYAAIYDNIAQELSTQKVAGKNVLATLQYNSGVPSNSTIRVAVRDLNSEYLVITDLAPSYDATGGEIKPVPTLTMNGTRLVYGTDFSITYQNNVEPGTATMVIKGEGLYIGSITRQFKITPNAANPNKFTGTWKKAKNGKWWFSLDAASKAKYGKDWPADEFAQIGSNRYYFNGSGYMATGWQAIGSKWYYFGGAGDGALKTGWKKIGGKWYYFDSIGVMQNTKQQIGGATYNFASSGAMLTGWQKEADGWYYYQSSGAMKTGWFKSKGVWYYLNPETNGRMKTGNIELDGKTYFFDSNGAMYSKDWINVMGKWVYVGASGDVQKNKWIGDYFVGEDGYMVTDQWIGEYYVGSDGKWDPMKTK